MYIPPDHCWHGVSGLTLDMLAPVHPVRCCYCGTEGGLQYVDGQRPPGHGKYAPLTRLPRYTVPGPCGARSGPAITQDRRD